MVTDNGSTVTITSKKSWHKKAANSHWLSAPIKGIFYTVVSFFLGAVLIFAGSILSELVGKNSSTLRYVLICLAIGGGVLWFHKKVYGHDSSRHDK